VEAKTRTTTEVSDR